MILMLDRKCSLIMVLFFMTQKFVFFSSLFLFFGGCLTSGNNNRF